MFIAVPMQNNKHRHFYKTYIIIQVRGEREKVSKNSRSALVDDRVLENWKHSQ